MKLLRTIASILTAQVFLACAHGQVQKPELIVQTGHTNEVEAMAISTDGRLLATGSSDNVLKLWDAHTGLELRAFQSPTRLFYKSLTFISDNSMLAAVCNVRRSLDKTIKVWDVASGKVLHSLSGNFLHVAVSPSGDVMAAVGEDQITIRIFDLNSGKEIRSLTDFDDGVNAIDFSPDGKTIVSGRRNQIDLWDVSTGKLLRTFEGHEMAAVAVAFSLDGSTIVTGGADGLLKTWDVETGRNIGGFQLDTWAHRVSISRDGSTIGADTFRDANGNSVERAFDVIDPADAKVMRTIAGNFGSFLLALDKREVFVAHANGAVRVMNIDTGNETADFAGTSQAIFSLAFGPDGSEIATGSRGNVITLWKAGQTPHSLTGHSNAVLSVRFNPVDGGLISASWDKTIRMWDGVRELRTLKGHTAEVQSLAASPDGMLIASGGRDKTVRLWNASTGRLLKTLTGHTDVIDAVAFSPDSKRLMSAGSDKTLKLWDVKNANVIWSVSTDTAEISTGMFSPDGKLIAGGGWLGYDGKLMLWDAETGEKLGDFEGLHDWVYSAAFSPDSKTIVTGSLNNKIQLWDTGTGRKLKDFPGLSSPIHAVAFSPDGKFIGSGSEDGVSKIWDAESGKELCSLMTFGDKDWLVVTPDGFFDGTPDAWKKIRWRFNNDTFDHGAVELYFNDFFYPNLLQDVLAGNVRKPRGGQELETIDRRQPTVEMVLAGSSSLSDTTAAISIEVVENSDTPMHSAHGATSGARDLRLFRNGSLVKIWHGDLFKLNGDSGCEEVFSGATGEPRRMRCRVQVPIVAGENRFTAYAFNSADVKSTDSVASINGAASIRKPGTLFVLAVGVNKYANSAYNLNFAVADVVEIGKALRDAQARMAGDPNPKQYKRTEVVSLTDENATKGNILFALRRFSSGSGEPIPDGTTDAARQELSKIRPAEPEDAIVIYYAGHGVSRATRFHLLPSNYTGQKDMSVVEEGISDIELNNVIEAIDAGQLIMVIDSCQSGQLLGLENEGRAPMNSKGLAQLAYDKGMYILTAAQSQQSALEAVQINGKTIKHGLLTYALLQAFTDAAADNDNNRQLWEREWLDYGVFQVPLLQADAMKQRHSEIQKTGRGVEIAYVNSDNNYDPKKRGVQTPRVFYRREADVEPFIITTR